MTDTIPEDRLAKLPQWAQDVIRKQRSEIASLKLANDRLVEEHEKMAEDIAAPGKGIIELEPYSFDPYKPSAVRSVPEQIRLSTKYKPRSTDGGFVIRAMPTGVEVSSYISGQLVITQSASNRVMISYLDDLIAEKNAELIEREAELNRRLRASYEEKKKAGGAR